MSDSPCEWFKAWLYPDTESRADRWSWACDCGLGGYPFLTMMGAVGNAVEKHAERALTANPAPPAGRTLGPDSLSGGER